MLPCSLSWAKVNLEPFGLNTISTPNPPLPFGAVLFSLYVYLLHLVPLYKLHVRPHHKPWLRSLTKADTQELNWRWVLEMSVVLENMFVQLWNAKQHVPGFVLYFNTCLYAVMMPAALRNSKTICFWICVVFQSMFTCSDDACGASKL